MYGSDFLGGVSIVVVGASHSSAPLSLLHQLAVPAGDTPTLLAELKGSAREGLVLSTCNRTELYAVTGHASSGAALLLGLLARRAGITERELSAHAYVLSEGDAVRHAFAVASGLDSMVLGEDQIQAQWKRAVAGARAAEALGPVLDRLGASALSCGKRVRTFTGVGRHSVSLESLAVRAAAERLGRDDLRDRVVLLMGAGESAALLVRHLRSAGAGRIIAMSRSVEKARAFADAGGIEWAPIQEIEAVVPLVDAIFCATAAPHPVLGHAHFRDWSSRGGGRPLVCVDLGMPSDVEAAVATVPDVAVVGMAQLSALAAQHREERRSHVPAAQAIVEAEVTRFLDWKAARGTAATAARLRAHAGQVATLEIDVALARLPDLAPRDREIVAALGRRIVTRLLHAPFVALREHPEAENIALALEHAFGLRGAGALDEAIPHPPEAADASEPIQDIA